MLIYGVPDKLREFVGCYFERAPATGLVLAAIPASKKSQKNRHFLAYIKKKNYLCTAKVEMALPSYNCNFMTTLTQEQKEALMADLRSFDDTLRVDDFGESK